MEITQEDLPVVHFPVTVRIGGNYAEHTGDLAGIVFENGVSARKYDFRKIMSFSAGFMVLEHERSGIKLTPLNLNTHFRAANATWNPWVGAEPEGCDRAIIGEDHEVVREALAVDPAQVADGADTAAKDPGVDLAPVGEDAAGPVADPAEVNAFGDDVADAPADATPIVAEGEQKIVLEALQSVLKASGARFLRQVCESRGIKPARDGETLVKLLLDSGITLAEVQAL